MFNFIVNLTRAEGNMVSKAKNEEAVQVVVRVRPLSDTEKSNGTSPTFSHRSYHFRLQKLSQM